MVTGKHKRKTSKKQPFWKKIKNPELKHLAEHIGKITDNSSWKDILDVALALTCGAAGWIAGENLGIKDFKIKAGMALSGAIAYRLATSGNLIAGASGTALLGAYGLIDVWNPLTGTLMSSYKAYEEWAKEAEKGYEEFKEEHGIPQWFAPFPFPFKPIRPYIKIG